MKNIIHKSENHSRIDGKKQGGFRLLREVCAAAAKTFAISADNSIEGRATQLPRVFLLFRPLALPAASGENF
ncbi:hypothetical protein QUW15_06860 [Desulfovibrio piger]|nr:hypothetical protein [Desulfovibrio piger]